MKGSFQINSVNLDSGIAKEAFSQERIATSIKGNMNTFIFPNLSYMHSAPDRKDWLYESCNKLDKFGVIF